MYPAPGLFDSLVPAVSAAYHCLIIQGEAKVAYCGSCGAEMPDDTRFCGRCGTAGEQAAPADVTAAAGTAAATAQSQPAQPAWPAAQAGTAATPRPQITFSLSRLRLGDLIAGGGSLLLLIALFLPWYSAHRSAVTRTPSPADIVHLESLAVAICGGSSSCLNNNNAPAISALHGGAGGWRVLILILAIITIVYLLIRAFLPTEPRLPVQHWQLALGLTALTTVLTLVALLANPLSALDGFGATATLGVGAIIGLIAALAAVAGSILLRQRPPHADQTQVQA